MVPFFLCSRMNGIPQGAMDGGAVTPMDGRTDICSW